MTMDKALVEEYQNAEYVVYAEPEFLMYVDTYCESLKRITT
jgi:hypothetical protein